MNRWLPLPGWSAVLFVVWLLLANSAAPAQLLLALVVAIAVPLAVQEFFPQRARLRRPGVVLRLAGTVLIDIVRSNIDVARRILGPERAIAPRFVWVPLAIRDPWGMVALAGIVTMTPGTLSADLDAEAGWLLVHALHVPGGEAGAQALVDSIKARYEAPLQEIFE